jgi:PIN domain nuclease of toxin-antitoxin system
VNGYLLDTHALVWFDATPDRLTASTLALVQTTPALIYVSAISLWEMGIKLRAGKFPEAEGLVENWRDRCDQLRLIELAFSGRHARDAALLEWDHKDPFDRALAAQARTEGLTLVTRDAAFTTCPGLTTLW